MPTWWRKVIAPPPNCPGPLSGLRQAGPPHPNRREYPVSDSPGRSGAEERPTALPTWVRVLARGAVSAGRRRGPREAGPRGRRGARPCLRESRSLRAALTPPRGHHPAPGSLAGGTRLTCAHTPLGDSEPRPQPRTARGSPTCLRPPPRGTPSRHHEPPALGLTRPRLQTQDTRHRTPAARLPRPRSPPSPAPEPSRTRRYRGRARAVGPRLSPVHPQPCALHDPGTPTPAPGLLPVAPSRPPPHPAPTCRAQGSPG